MADDSAIRGIILNIIADGIFVFGGWLIVKTQTSLKRRNPLLWQYILLLFGIVGMIINVLSYIYVNNFHIFSFLITFGILGFVVWKELNQFWQLGLVGAGRKIAAGLDYKQSLSLCSNSLGFLGIGASKLTREWKEFEGAIDRCHRPNRPIRLLLCDPGNEELIRMVRQAGRGPDEYQNTVKDSLRKIATLRIQREKNIKVRFYKELPLFRLMFIDDSLCLASHYVFGEGDGSQLPQLHVRKTIGCK